MKSIPEEKWIFHTKNEILMMQLFVKTA